MDNFKSGLNPFSSENLTTFLIISGVLTILIVIVFSIERFIIPRLNPDNRFVKWWEKHMVSEDPYDRGPR